jgi:hypothetical protein
MAKHASVCIGSLVCKWGTHGGVNTLFGFSTDSFILMPCSPYGMNSKAVDHSCSSKTQWICLLMFDPFHTKFDGCKPCRIQTVFCIVSRIGCETFGAHPIILRSCTKLLQMTRCASPSTIPFCGLWQMTIMMHHHGYERAIPMTVICSPVFVGKPLFL